MTRDDITAQSAVALQQTSLLTSDVESMLQEAWEAHHTAPADYDRAISHEAITRLLDTMLHLQRAADHLRALTTGEKIGACPVESRAHH